MKNEKANNQFFQIQHKILLKYHSFNLSDYLKINHYFRKLNMLNFFMANKSGLKRNRKLIIYVTAFLVLISVVALIFSFVLTNRMQDNIAINQLRITSERTESENASFYEELNTDLKVASRMVQSGIFAENNDYKWSVALESLLESNDHISSISVIDSSGKEYFASLNDSVFNYYLLSRTDSFRTTLYSVFLSSDSVSKASTVIETRAMDLDSYKNQIYIVPDSIVWYDIQSIAGMNKNLGLAASVKSVEKKSGNVFIITIYISLSTINNFLQTMAGNVHADIILFTDDHKILDLSGISDSFLEKDFVKYMIDWDSIKSPIIKKSIINWEKAGSKDSLHFQSFKIEKTKYWCAYKAAQRTSGLWIALVVQEDDFLAVLKEKMGILFFIPLVILLISSIVLIVVFKRRFYKFPEELLMGSGDILRLIEKGEDEHIEFKSTIRTNLFTNKPGKEIELAWLKSVVGFCNSEGGTILIGVSDKGEILGLEPDNFANDDKCLLHVQNLIKDHIGMEFSKYINYRLLSYNEKKILVVHCMMVSEPLFLISNNKEQFYVRSGPASIELPMSKALKYIEDRKNNH